MTKATLDILFKLGFSSSSTTVITIPVYDIKTGEEEGKRDIILPYNNSDEAWNLECSERAQRYILQRLLNEGYTFRKAVFGNEDVGWLVNKENRQSLIVFVLDSESEKRVWLGKMGKERYPVFVIRDRLIKEGESVCGVTIDEAFSSFNFLSR